MPTQLALDKTDPAVADILGMLTEGEPISIMVTAIPGPTEDPVVVLDVTDIEMEEMEYESKSTKRSDLMPETQLKEGGFDTGPVAPTKKNKPTQRPNQPHQ
jgi:hypothetical protein